MWVIGDTYRQTLATIADGEQADADSTPTGVLYVDGTATVTTVTVTAISTGFYAAECSLSGLANGNVCEVVITATIGGNTFVQGLGAFRLDAAVSSRLAPATEGRTLTVEASGAARAVDGAAAALATQADVLAINQSAARRIILATVGTYERPESGSSTYTVEARTYDGDGAAVNADSTPTLTATGIVSGSLAANLSSAANPATGVYRWTYTVPAAHAIEQIRFDVSTTMSTAFTLSAYTQVADFVAATWTTATAAQLAAIHAKLPSKSYLAGTNNSDGDLQLNEATGTLADGAITSAAIAADAITDAKVAADVAVLVADKTGFKLASDGIDAISTTPPTGVATTFRQMLIDIWRFFYKRTRHNRTTGIIETFADDNNTVKTTQSFTRDGAVENRGAAS